MRIVCLARDERGGMIDVLVRACVCVAGQWSNSDHVLVSVGVRV